MLAIASPVWLASVTPRETLLTVFSMLRMEASAPLWILLIIPVICWVDAAERLARLRTSSATTAKPRPCSPARAASMAALSASRLV